MGEDLIDLFYVMLTISDNPYVMLTLFLLYIMIHIYHTYYMVEGFSMPTYVYILI